MASVEGGLTVVKDIPVDPPRELSSTAYDHELPPTASSRDVESNEEDIKRIEQVYK